VTYDTQRLEGSRFVTPQFYQLAAGGSRERLTWHSHDHGRKLNEDEDDDEYEDD